MWPDFNILTENNYPMVYIIDCEKKGNVVRFYLGNNPDYHGDDWDDYPYEENCSKVYDKYILGYKDVIFPFEYSVLEPVDDYRSTNYCRNHFKQGIVPCLVAVDNSKFASPCEVDSFSRALGYKDAKKYYFGDIMTPDVWLKKDTKEPKQALLISYKKYIIIYM